MKTSKALYFWIIAVSFFAGLVLAQYHLKQRGSDLIPGAGGNFTLQAANGPVSLSDYRGKVVAIYFGYMSCPDICPTSLWSLTEAINQLPPEQAEQVQPVFVSVDPERDSPEALAIFVKGYRDNFVGLTDNKKNIDKVARQYSVIYEKVPLKESAMGYVMDHTSVIYLVDRRGVLQYYLPHDTPPNSIRGDLVKLLTES